MSTVAHSIRWLAVAFAVVQATPALAVGAQDRTFPNLDLMTETWVPYQFKDGGQLRGVSVDLLELMLNRVGSTQTRDDMDLLPWARAYGAVQAEKNAVLFSTTRTPERDALFKWVGPIFTNDTYLIGKRARGFHVTSKDDLRRYVFGVVIGDASALFAKRLGIPPAHMVMNTGAINNVHMLSRDRIDFVVTGWAAFLNDAKAAHVDPSLYEEVYLADRSDVSFAFNAQTPDWVIEKLQAALDALKADGTYDKVFARYRALLPK